MSLVFSVEKTRSTARDIVLNASHVIFFSNKIISMSFLSYFCNDGLYRCV